MPENITIDIVVHGANARQEFKKTSSTVSTFGRTTQRESRRTTSALANVKSSAKSYLGTAGLAGIAAGAGMAVSAAYGRMMQKGAQFEQQLADLEAITGITGNSLQELGDHALESSVQYGEAASNIVEAQKLVASQLAEKIDFGTDEGLQQLKAVADQAIVLQKAAGISLQQAVSATTKSINQFNLSADEAGRVTNVLAAGAQKGAAEVDYLSQALEEAGIGAAGAGEDIETTVAALEVLAKNGIDAAKAGTGLRNVFTILQGETQKLADQGIQDLNIEQEGLIASLRRARPLLEDATALNKVFGREVSNTARALLSGVDSIEKLEQQITGTNTASEQAAVQLNTYEGASAQLAATLDKELISAFQETNGAMVESINLLSDIVATTGGAIREMNDWVEMQAELEDQLGTMNYLWQQHFGIFADASNAVGLTQSVDDTRQWIQAQQDATEATRHKVDLLQEDIKFYRDQAEAAEEGSAKQQAYTKQLGKAAAQLGVMKGQLEAQRNSLQNSLNSAEEGTTEYERMEFMLREVEERLGSVTDAQSELSRSTEEAGGSSDDAAVSAQNLSDQLDGLKERQEELLNVAGDWDEAQRQEFVQNAKKIEQIQQIREERKKQAQAIIELMNASQGIGRAEMPDTGGVGEDVEGGSLEYVQTIEEKKLAELSFFELRQRLSQAHRDLMEAETEAQWEAARQQVDAIRMMMEWQENKAKVVFEAVATVSGATAELMDTVGAGAAAVKSAALIEIAANSAAAVSAAVKSAAAVPWPANIGAIASAIAAVMSGITQAYMLLDAGPSTSTNDTRSSGEQRMGFASGGMVPVALSNGEYQVSANAARGNEGLLSAINADPAVAKRLSQAALARAQGGVVRGPGSGTSDSIQRDVEPGTFIVNAKSTRAARPLLDMIEARRYAAGGQVGASSQAVIQQITSDQTRVIEAINEQTRRLEKVQQNVKMSLYELDYNQRIQAQNEELQ